MAVHFGGAAYTGLTSSEAERRLAKYGENLVPEDHRNPLVIYLSKFWGPIPWMLEATMVLQFVLGKYSDALIILALLVVNTLISFSYEQKAQHALDLLQQKLRIQARVLRDGAWKIILAQELAPGDVILLRAGDLVPADAMIKDGSIAVDQSSLTGESALVEIEVDQEVRAGSVVRRGEAVVEVSATGMRTSFNKTIKLIQSAQSTDQGDVFVHKIVTYLLSFTLILAAGVLLMAWVNQLPFFDVLLFALALLIAAIPVSLPLTFTLASAAGARRLIRHNVLATHLAAVREVAIMDVLCSDKTGTITQNKLNVTETCVYGQYTLSDLLELASLASDGASQDPIDIAILEAAQSNQSEANNKQQLEFIPFDPATKRTESLVIWHNQNQLRVVKGSPPIISSLTNFDIDLTADVEKLAMEGNRCIAIAAGKPGEILTTVGLIGLRDEPRQDAAMVVDQLHKLGVRVIMITGDDLPTARSVANSVGIRGLSCTQEAINTDLAFAATKFDIFARVYPEDKYKLVEALQNAGHVVGMTGDGINDAPAIRQADIGIAVNNATDITKSAASLILTTPGLKDMLSVIETGRSIFQRITTYTLNKIIKTFHLGLFLTIGLIMTGSLMVTPMHILLMVLANDFVSMSLTTDRVSPSKNPDRWRSTPLVICGLALAFGWLLLSFGIYYFGKTVLGFKPGQLETTMFLMLVFIAILNVYLIRERDFLWKSPPNRWLMIASMVDLAVVVFLGAKGVLMTALGFPWIIAILGATVAFMFLLDIPKVWLLRRLGMQK